MSIRFFSQTFVVSTAILLSPNLVFAAAENAGRVTTLPGGILAQVLLALLFTILAIFSLAWGAKKLGCVNYSTNNKFQLLGQFSLGNKEKVVLLEVNQVQLLLGVTAEQINKLHVFKQDGKNSSIATEDFLPDKDIKTSANDLSDQQEKNKSKQPFEFSHYIQKMLMNGKSL